MRHGVWWPKRIGCKISLMITWMNEDGLMWIPLISTQPRKIIGVVRLMLRSVWIDSWFIMNWSKQLAFTILGWGRSNVWITSQYLWNLRKVGGNHAPHSSSILHGQMMRVFVGWFRIIRLISKKISRLLQVYNLLQVFNISRKILWFGHEIGAYNRIRILETLR